MAGARGQVVTSLGIHLEEGVPIDLRGSLEATAFLTIGDGIEVVLGESHLRVLRDRADAAERARNAALTARVATGG